MDFCVHETFSLEHNSLSVLSYGTELLTYKSYYYYYYYYCILIIIIIITTLFK